MGCVLLDSVDVEHRRFHPEAAASMATAWLGPLVDVSRIRVCACLFNSCLDACACINVCLYCVFSVYDQKQNSKHVSEASSDTCCASSLFVQEQQQPGSLLGRLMPQGSKVWGSVFSKVVAETG